MSKSSAILSAAREYPYEMPVQSFVYRDNGASEFDRSLCAQRTPVLAIGSNQSPSRLAQKFGHDASHVIPVQRARLRDFDVVYSAHISRYGAVPAMLQVSEGATVSIAVTWLNDAQVEIMNASEVHAANYSFARLEHLVLALDDGSILDRAYAYVSSRGHLHHDGAVGLAAIHCDRRQNSAMITAEMLEVVRARVAPDTQADDFVVELVSNDDYRRQVTDRISTDAVPFAYPFEIVSGGG